MYRLCLLLLPVSALLGCNSGSGKVDDDDDDDEDEITDTDDIERACEENRPETLRLTVEFPAPDPGCAWGEDGNDDREDTFVTARLEQLDSLELPDDAVICDVVFDFEGVSGGEGTPMVYDDAFLFTFNDVVLAASQGSMVGALDIEDEIFYTYKWSKLRGSDLEFGTGIQGYCLGEDDGLADCDIPDPETPGIMSLSFEEDIVNELSLRAVSQSRYDFAFITMGDNDDTDCYHEDFAFEVEIPYVSIGR